MREILFRGKELKTGKWAYGNYYYEAKHKLNPYFITWNGKDALGNFGDRYHPVNNVIVDKDTISQFTGLKDKNGTKIFEGDIVWIDEYEPTLATIKWDNNCAMFYILLEDLYYTFDDYYGKDLIVTGNIYDNPELLE